MTDVVVVVSGIHLYDCVAPYVDSILHRGQFWAKSAASGRVRWRCLRSWATWCGTTWLSSPVCQREANGILLASTLSSMRTMCPNRVSWHDWIIAVSLGCFTSLHTSSFQRCLWCIIVNTRKHTETSVRLMISAVFSLWDFPQQFSPMQ